MKRKNKSARNSARSQSLPTAANAGETAFAHGISRRVVVVDAADSQLFEQIIYIVRDNAAGGGVTAADIVRQCAGGARTAAKAKILHRLADRSVLRRRCAYGSHRILPVLRLVSGRFSRRPGRMLPFRGVFCANSGCQRLPKVLE